MKGLKGRLLGLLIALSTLALPGVGSDVAMADDPALDPVVDLTDVLEGQGIDPWTNPLTAADACWADSGPQANVPNVPYKQYTKGSTQYWLVLDVYVPQQGAPPGPYPAAVTVHGGGWVGGCRVWLDGLARQMAQRGFVVFNIDYRLACDDPGVPLCGPFHFPAAADDTKSAIS